MSLYSLYDQINETRTPPCVVGGVNRAKYAVRDEQGRFMPVKIERWNTWTLDPKHGVNAGKIRAIKAHRDMKGRFTK